MTPNQSLFSSRNDPLRLGGDFPDLLERGGLTHFGLHLGQHARHCPVALGMAAELAPGAETVESRADRRNGDGDHHENIFSGLRQVKAVPGDVMR